MEQHGEPERGARVELVADGLVERGAQRLGVTGQVVLGVRGDVGGGVEHLERVLEDVQVVERALLAAVHRAGLGQDHVEHAEPVEQADGGVGMVGRHEAPHLGVDPLAGGPVGQVGVAAGQPLGVGVDLEPELVRDPGEAQQPERVVGEDPVRDEAQSALRQVAEAAERVDDARLAVAVDRDRHRVHGEVALAQVGQDIAPALRGDVERAAVKHDAPRPVGLGERERRPPGLAGEPPGNGRRVAGHHHVDVGHREPEADVADAPADEVRPVVADQAPELVKHLGGHAPPSVAEERATSRSRS